MSEKSEALRLANFLEMHWCNVDMPEAKAAAELRRQHEEITELRHGAGVANQTIAGLVAQRDALLAALNQCLKGTLIGGHTHNDNGLEVLAQRCGAPHIANELRRLANIARAVIKAVEGEKE